MNNYILIFVLFFSFNLFCQNKSNFNLNIPHETTIYSSEDTIIGFPLITNHDFNFLINNSFSEFSDFNNAVLTFDFTDYVKKNKPLSFNFFSENNLLYLGIPKIKSYSAFGFKFSSYFDLDLSGEIINLLWNGNSQFADEIIHFNNNTSSFLQYSSLFFQYSSVLSQNLMYGLRVSLLHGINYFDLNKGNFSLQSYTNSTTPYSSLIQTDIFFESSRANIFGISNPGLSFNFGLNYSLRKFQFLFDLHNLGFIYWNKRTSQHSSVSDYLFNGVNYTMDQILTEEISTTIDSLENIFALNNISSNSFFSYTPIKIRFMSIYNLNFSTKFFVDYKLIQNSSSKFRHYVFFGLDKFIQKNTSLKLAYNINEYSFDNFKFSITRKFKNYLVSINTNNLISILNINKSNYFNLQFGVYYFF